MAISGDKKRIVVTIEKDLEPKLRALAEKDNRNLSNYIATLLERHIEENKKDIQ
ncbi:DNA-binding protein [Bacillus salipaludis]|uniref:DNA-binding protein n=1 Tax=Bacillus salipaludis TaxID=2547811 RepID=A0A4R5VLG5_9BACI|nr:DNA-binding protein [Bacillus salipaludis]MDQ6599240.1 hypothetical protein [Bacillus salipaludis]TDK58883.1 DNA-binding protein [Bacillus salipaludis]